MKYLALIILVFGLTGCETIGGVAGPANIVADAVDDVCASGVVDKAQSIESTLESNILVAGIRAQVRETVRQRGHEIELNLADAVVINCNVNN